MKWIFKGICVALVATGFVFGLGWVTMHLWNWIIPGLTGWHALDYWHAIGLLVLCKILFGSFRKGGGCGGRCGHGRWGGKWGHHRHGAWKKRWEEKMANMSPEERERVKMGMNKCGWGWDDSCEPAKAEGSEQS